LSLGRNMDLRPFRIGYFPVRVIALTSTGWTFGTRKYHPDYPNGTIQFRFFKSNGRMNLRTVGYIPWYTPGGACMASPNCRTVYLSSAYYTWNDFAGRLRSLAARYR
jgi:hypothetical protein